MVVAGVEVKSRVVLERDEEAIRKERTYWRFPLWGFYPRFSSSGRFAMMKASLPSIHEDRISEY